ncbi:MAG: glycosyltransferase family 4 protein, partial [Bryobacteraceae bacterium]
MNILCIEQFPKLGGGQRSLIDLLPAFSSRRWRPRVAVPGQGPFCEAVRELGYETDDLDCSWYSSIRKPARQIVKYASEFPRTAAAITGLVQARGIDLIYVNGPRLLPAAAWSARQQAIPLVFHCHSRLLQPSAILTAGASLWFSRAWMIACCSHVREPLREFVKPGRIRVIYNGLGALNIASFRLPDRLRRIGVIGRIEPEKGQMEFIRAARLVSREFRDCQFFVIGAPMFSSTAYYERVVAESQGLPVKFAGWRDDIPQVFSDLDLLVVPSTPVEATARVILEAYTAGVPVVAFPSGGIPEIVKDGKTGFLAADFTHE